MENYWCSQKTGGGGGKGEEKEDDVWLERLAEHQIVTFHDLLVKGMTPDDRSKLSNMTEVPVAKIKSGSVKTDLSRLPNINEKLSNLLVKSGIKSVKDLAERNPEELQKILEITNKQKKIVGILHP